MKKKGISITLLILGILTAVVPQAIFPVDPVMPDMVMVCHYTAQALIVTGLLTAVYAFLSLIDHDAAPQWDLAAALAGAGSFLIILLIGFCTHSDAKCRIGTQPAEIILNAAVIIIGIYGFIALGKDQKKQ